MAHSLSAKKRVRQTEVRRARNQARRSALKTQIRKFEDALRNNDLGQAAVELKTVHKRLDQTGNTSVMHRNAAARKKSRLTKRYNRVAAAAAQ